jgi:Uncharacterized protein conserved in bacteria
MDEQARRKIVEVVRIHSARALGDSNFCRGVVKDYCFAYKREQSALLAVVSQGGIVILLDGQMELIARKNRIITKMCSETALDKEAVIWAVDTWALALGVADRDRVLEIAGSLKSRMEQNADPDKESGSDPLAGVGQRIYKKVTYFNGHTYEGDVKDNKKDGEGVYTWPGGNRYEGSWKNDKINGRGAFTFASGERYEGMFENGKRNGKGSFTWPNGDRYEGDWKDDIKEGKGVYVWPNGNRYEGDWKNGKKEGKGVYTCPNGSRYKGNWKDDVMHGYGKYTDAKGKSRMQRWVNGKQGRPRPQSRYGKIIGNKKISKTVREKRKYRKFLLGLLLFAGIAAILLLVVCRIWYL